MTHMSFDESLVTGDATIDAQHRSLFELFDQLSVDEGGVCQVALVQAALDALHDYTIEHFAAEQQMIVSAELPAADQLTHFEEHRDLTHRVRQLVLDYRSGQVSDIAPVVELLGDWLANHIRRRDRELVEYLDALDDRVEVTG